ncbi:transcriptional regulator [Streptococcus ferus]|uniref:Transcriptional regulator n=2 Tax=Streptococcus ferus TaxID=1345 RepID=A0A2X3Y188_9STRE|nr:transcriptional regulator [Streptococcus ferus]
MLENITFALDRSEFSEYNKGVKGAYMGEKELRRSMSVFPIGTVMKLTDLSARQIRYYEEQGLLTPNRSEGNRRLYSLNDMDRLLEIRDFLEEGLNIVAIKKEYAKRKDQQRLAQKTLTDEDVRRILQDELRAQGGFQQPSHRLR